MKGMLKKIKNDINIPVIFYDESYSTIQAQNMLLSLGQNTKSTKDKIDMISATVFLQEFLNSKQSKNEKLNELTEDEQKELKQKYRKASKLCHPDVVSEEQKELADKLFAELNAAYERNDLKRVREILENLEKGNFFVSKSDSITEKQLLKAEIEKLRMRIKELKEQMFTIKESEAFNTISSIEDWDVYFKETKEKLQEQAKGLRNE